MNSLGANIIQRGKKFYGVDIPRGKLVLEECDITSDSLACVAIHGKDSDPTVRGCKIHDSKESCGVYVREQGKGTIEGCDVFANGDAGVEIKEGGDPTMCRCRITLNGSQAVRVFEGGRGTVEECDLRENQGGPWDIGPDCSVISRGNLE